MGIQPVFGIHAIYQQDDDGAPTDAPYLLFGTDGDLTAAINLYSFYGGNLIRNSPGQIVTDGVQPQWWTHVLNATITDEDTAGEGIPDLHDRCFKVVTTADDVYGYQSYAISDEQLIDAGVTELSLGVWAYCATGGKARISIYGANGGEQNSDYATAAGWNLLLVEGYDVHVADVILQVRLKVDTDTAWFTMPMFSPGPKVLPWVPRGTIFVPQGWTNQLTLNPTSDVAWSDTDCTANTDPLAVLVQCRAITREPDGNVGSAFGIGHDSALTGADVDVLYVVIHAVDNKNYESMAMIACDDSQVIRYRVEEVDNDTDMVCTLALPGYWRWA